MNKKVVVVLLCISGHGIGMDRPLSGSQPTPELKIVRYCHKKLLDVEERYAHTLLGFVQHNAVPFLKDCLKNKDQRAICSPGMMIPLPDVLQRVLRHSSSAQILHEAVHRCYYNCAELLLAYNAHPNAKVKGGETPLHVVSCGTIVQLLMDHGACIEQKNDAGETPFFKNIKKSYLDRAKILHDAGADVNTSDTEGDTPLHYAANCLGEDVIKFLLYRGARIDSPNKQCETPCQMIYRRGGAILKAFREWQTFFHAINFTIEENRFLTIMSLLADDAKQLRNILMQNSSDYCSEDIAIAEKLFNQCGDTAWNALTSNSSLGNKKSLMLARFIQNRSRHRNAFLKALCENNFRSAHHYLEVNPYLLHTYEGEYDKDEVNAIFADKILFCISDDQYCYLQKMIHDGVFDVNYCDELGVPLLSVVILNASSGNKYLDLLKGGACVNAKDKYGNTPLFYAVILEGKDMIAKLLLYGAVVNKDFGESFNLSDEMWELMNDAYCKQKCVTCETHDQKLFSIPCVNRHIGHFICTQCYDKNSQKRCPLCRRSMGKLGC